MTVALRQRPLAQVVNSIVKAGNGCWLDPSDISTLYQDAAGTTPVTAVEQPVGLMLDKSRGMMLGPELVTNGDFSNGASGWTLGAGYSASNGVISRSYTGTVTNINQLLTLKPNTVYQVRASVTILSGAYFRVELPNVQFYQINTSGNFSFKIKTTSTISNTTIYIYGDGNIVGSIDNISVREIYGNHATQSITASRPTLSARYNLLTKTEDFSDAVWVKQYLTVSARITHASGVLVNVLTEDITNNLHYIREATGSVIGNKYKYICILGKKERKYAALYASTPGVGVIFDLESCSFFSNLISAPLSYSIRDLGNGLCECSISYVATSISTAPAVYICNDSGQYIYAGDGASGIYVAQAELRDEASFLPYQRVNTATDYDTNPALFPKYLKFDGVDDYLNLPYMGLYAGGSASVVMAGRTSAQWGVVISEGSTTSGSPQFAPLLTTTETGDTLVVIRDDNNGNVLLHYTPSMFDKVSVVSSIISESDSKAYRDSVFKTALSYTRSTPVTMNTTAIGARVSTSVVEFFGGNIYGLIITKSALTDAQRVRCERFLARKAGVML